MRLLVLVLCCRVAQAKTLTYWVEPCSSPESGCHSGDTALAQWALEAWQTASGGRLILQKAADRDTAHIQLYWVSGNAGLFGETRPIVVNGVPGAAVYVLPTIVPSTEKDEILRDAIVYLTCLHETGHALGLAHTATFTDIMYSFQYGGNIREYFARYRRKLSTRDDIRRNSGISKDDREHLTALYPERPSKALP
jgi:hypothetical protein